MRQSGFRGGVSWWVVGLLAAVPAVATASGEIRGDYVEARTSDVYTGPCFANGEVGLTGREAVMAWRVREGSWQGVDLSGLSVVAVVKAAATLGDPHATPYPARAVVILDASFAGPGRARLAVTGLVDLETRALGHHDHICGNEFVYYPPLSPVTDAVPAYTLANRFEGHEFKSTWSSPLKRSAFVATFSAGAETDAVD